MADIYGALSEDRPYRAGLPPEQILAILGKDVPSKLDPDVFEALKVFMERSPTSDWQAKLQAEAQTQSTPELHAMAS